MLTQSNRAVSCKFFESFDDITCQFFKCSVGSSCQQLELVNEQSGTGNMITLQLDVTQFQANDTMEFIVRGSNLMKSIDVQGMLMTGTIQKSITLCAYCIYVNYAG